MLFMWPREGNGPNAHQLVNSQADCGLSAQWNIIQTRKGMKGLYLLRLG